jgi:hypothetical protein
MPYERVHIIWDFYDGVRTGIADLNGGPHYFASLYDENEEHSDNFNLYPVAPEFMQRAVRNWDIYRAWERKFHSGETDFKAHPGHHGTNAEYDELKSRLDYQITRLQRCRLFTERNSAHYTVKKVFPAECSANLKSRGRLHPLRVQKQTSNVASSCPGS